MKKRICRFLGLLVLMGGLCSGVPAMAQQQKGSAPWKVPSGANSLSKQASAMRSVPATNVNRATVAPAKGKPASGIVRGDQRGNLGVALVTGKVVGGPALGNQRGNLGVALVTGKVVGGPALGNQRGNLGVALVTGKVVGGPVNGTGPSVGQAAGISNLDLLRQFAEGQSTGGGPNQMLNGRLGRNQVRPIGETGTSFGGPNRNGINISINPEESVRGGNNTTGGGDRPD